MTGVRLHDVGSSERTLRRLGVVAALMAAAVLTAVGGATPAADADEVATCASVAPSPEAARTINLVLDDSGSMFDDNGEPIDRWSFAKYSVEVFAALMGPDDTLKVFLMSDPNSPALTLAGSTPVDTRVQEVHDLPFEGGDTPYQAVLTASRDLEETTDSNGAANAWLVVLTDGEFRSDGSVVPTSQVARDLTELCEKGISVAFMSIGANSPDIEGVNCVQFEFVKASTSTDLLEEMTGFSNSIFNRALVPDQGTSWDLDIPLQELKVFAQGANVQIRSLTTSRGPIEPSSTVGVQWTTNPDVTVDDRNFTPVPNRDLEGLVATFANIPAGSVSLDVANASEISYFFKPSVKFGATLKDASGQTVVTGGTFSGQSYTLDYGLMDDSCQFIQSRLLPDVSYDATLTNGVEAEKGIQPGDTITFLEGDVVLDISAEAAGLTALAQINLTGSSPTPGAPSRVFAAAADSNARVSWEPPQEQGAGDIVSYTVTANPPDGTCTADGALTCEVNGLTNGVSYTFTVTATNSAGLEGPPSEPSVPVVPYPNVNRAYLVSTLGDYPPDDEGMRVALIVKTEGGSIRPLGPDEWAALNDDSIQCSSEESMECDVRKQEQVGELLVLPRAPGGDIYSASLGVQTVTVTLPANEQFGLLESSVNVEFEVIDDISGWDRLKHWLLTTGLRLLLGLLLLAVILGYIFKKRFPKNIKKSPSINGRPRVIGPQSLNATGQFQKNLLRQFLPFVADTAVLTYVPFGVMGFAPFQLKAGPSKMLKLENWRQIAAQNNVQINGLALDPDTTTTQPVFHAAAPITAETPQMTYDMSAIQ